MIRFQRAIGAPERTPFPVIVAVHGPVIGLGVDMISVCDIRYAASNASFAIKVELHILFCLFFIAHSIFSLGGGHRPST
jgi:hypothetical protein